MTLGRALEDFGDEDGALDCYRNVLRRQPGNAPALGRHFRLIDEEVDPVLLARGRALLFDGDDDKARAVVGYGLAMYHDRRGDFATAAEAARAANAARRREAGPLDRTALAARVDRLIDTYSRGFFKDRRRWGAGTDQPVFIVGLPRSGSELVERMMSVHPLMHGAGELPDLAHIAAHTLGRRGMNPELASLRVRGGMHCHELAGDYLRALRGGAPPGRRRISDSQPMNGFHLAFAALLFPNARVVHCLQDARDSALSIWMEGFDPEQHFATDLDDIAFFTAQYQRLMAHWRGVLPLPILEVRYEDMIADLETQARRLIDFLGVPWDARCLAFDEYIYMGRTAGGRPARPLIDARPAGHWRNYIEHVPGLDPAF